MFGISGENLTRRLRSETFKKMLSQEIGWFDKQENNVGVLCTKLAVEASAVQGVRLFIFITHFIYCFFFKLRYFNLKATGVRIGFFLNVSGNLGLGIILSFVFGWAIALVIFAFIPLMIISGVVQTKMLSGFSSKDKEIFEEAGKVNFHFLKTL